MKSVSKARSNHAPVLCIVHRIVCFGKVMATGGKQTYQALTLPQNSPFHVPILFFLTLDTEERNKNGLSTRIRGYGIQTEANKRASFLSCDEAWFSSLVGQRVGMDRDYKNWDYLGHWPQHVSR